MKLYIFTIRDVVIEGKVQYNGLIPKLFDYLENEINPNFEKYFNKSILKEKSLFEVFFDLLKINDNLLWKGNENIMLNVYDYLNLNDKYKIIYLNLLNFKKKNMDKMKL